MTEEDPENAISRRRFLKLASTAVAAGAGTVLLSDRIFEIVGVSTVDTRTISNTSRQWVMLIDLAKCNGCGSCTAGCREAHFVPDGQEWICVQLMEDELGARFFLPQPCMQCENAPCLNVCPVGATFRRDDGVVFIDHERCIGCRYCMAACPYGARSFNWVEPQQPPEALAHTYSIEEPWPHRRGVVEKCIFCTHNARQGQLPACVQACTSVMGSGAIYFGDLREDAVSNGVETIPLARTLREKGGFRLKSDLGTRPRVWYLPARG